MNNQIRKDFTITPNALINSETISPIARFLFVWLCSKPETWKFHNNVIQKSMKFGKDSRIKYMRELVETGWISVKQKMNQDGTFGENEITLNPCPILSDTVKSPQLDFTDTEIIRDGQTPTHNKTNLISNINLSKKTESKKANKSDLRDFILKDVINYLNEKKPSKKPFEFTKGNTSHLNARIKEGFTLEDFKTVIDFKVSEWGKDLKMKKFIRPETLFGSKFNGYLVSSEDHKPENDGSGNFEYKPQEKADLL